MDFHQIFNDSYQRCQRHPQFFQIFYRNFWQQEERFQKMFENVDMTRQIKMLKLSILMIMLASTSEEAKDNIRRYARRHGPDGIGAQPEDFDIWIDSLLKAVKECDTHYNSDIDKAWRTCFKTGMEIMKQETQLAHTGKITQQH
ncbi:hypothetical protein ABT56_07590 [Photobacterium aquae]|uniref:Globin n=1 Tax=Photobacterium aquae TaxID=1195763 RepID=A0A0J1H5I9_9GAMM|nr:globin [Photobacterium aquae]KLV07000.1 hypothetical protein ABT56_07590 [Photobacterium aquae]